MTLANSRHVDISIEDKTFCDVLVEHTARGLHFYSQHQKALKALPKFSTQLQLNSPYL